MPCHLIVLQNCSHPYAPSPSSPRHGAVGLGDLRRFLLIPTLISYQFSCFAFREGEEGPLPGNNNRFGLRVGTIIRAKVEIAAKLPGTLQLSKYFFVREKWKPQWKLREKETGEKEIVITHPSVKYFSRKIPKWSPQGRPHLCLSIWAADLAQILCFFYCLTEIQMAPINTLFSFQETLTWIGLSDIRSSGNFAWSDNSRLTYTNWLNEQNIEIHEGRDNRDHKKQKRDYEERKHEDEQQEPSPGGECAHIVPVTNVLGNERSWGKWPCNDQAAKSPFVCRIQWI